MGSHEGPRIPEATSIDAPRHYRFPRDPAAFVSWGFVEERLQAARSYWLATTYPDGRPHVAPVWGLWLDGALWFDGLPTTRWARNLAQNPSLCVHLESAEEVVILEGMVEDLETDLHT
ncbi:MAG TPA: pyridoxamine 5'-phosphate oxidase family protein, partial [Thermomicrobiales bacterium]|nr:pyridoxamine 5'-phosphate oxidase family protein [Thermomicrobiales bacterium]